MEAGSKAYGGRWGAIVMGSPHEVSEEKCAQHACQELCVGPKHRKAWLFSGGPLATRSSSRWGQIYGTLSPGIISLANRHARPLTYTCGKETRQRHTEYFYPCLAINALCNFGDVSEALRPSDFLLQQGLGHLPRGAFARAGGARLSALTPQLPARCVSQLRVTRGRY